MPATCTWPQSPLVRQCATRFGTFSSLWMFSPSVGSISRIWPVSTSLLGSSRPIANELCSVSPRRPADLHVAPEHHAVRSPVVDRVGEHVDVHEDAVGLADQQRAPFTVRVTQSERRLARVRSDAEQVERELELDRIVSLGGRHRALDAETALLDRHARLAVAAVDALGIGDLGRPEGVVPVRVHASEIVDRVDLGKTEDLERLVRLRCLRRRCGPRRQHGNDCHPGKRSRPAIHQQHHVWFSPCSRFSRHEPRSGLMLTTNTCEAILAELPGADARYL